MKIKTTMTALGMAITMVVASGCAREEAETAAVIDTPVVAPTASEPVETSGEAPMVGNDMTAWDSSGDTMLDANEFGTGFDSRWSTWDGDADGKISKTEFDTASSTWGDAPGGVDKNGLFDTWDADKDGLLDNNEFRTGSFSTWDADRNNTIDNNEYTAGNGWFGW